ncbi:hypothetical protein BDV06DRAFT_233252 [Aspergillus oleicola]
MTTHHVLDSRGEVILVILNSNAPFADWIPPSGEDVKSSHPSKQVTTQEQKKNDTNLEDSAQDTEDVPDASAENVNPDVRIQVSARHLMLGSPVFDKMLSGNWAEGRELKEIGSIELSMDGWDIEALLVVLNTLHARLSEIPRKMTVEQLAKVAIIADYYDCQNVKCLANWWKCCVPASPPDIYSREVVLGLWVAHFFDYKDHYRAYANSAVLHSDGYIIPLGIPFPEDIIDSLNDERISMISKELDIVYEYRDSLLNDASGLKGSPSKHNKTKNLRLGDVTKLMHSLKLGHNRPDAPYLGIRYLDAYRVALLKA